MYVSILVAHSWLRYVLLGLGLALLVVSFTGWRGGSAWTAGKNRLRTATVGMLDLQTLLGLLLYFVLSPITQVAMGDMKMAMKDPTLRFYGVEHIFTMLIGLVVMHVGSVRARKKDNDGDRHRVLFISTLIWLVLVLASIPWPGLDIGRPLFRM